MTRMPLKRKRVVEDVIAAPGMGKEPVSKNNKPGRPGTAAKKKLSNTISSSTNSTTEPAVKERGV